MAFVLDSWQDIAKRTQKAVADSIPADWRIEKVESKVLNVSSLPESCGLLSAKELSITSQTGSQLLQHLTVGKLTSVEVVQAFCKRAAIAQQLVSHW